MSDSTTLGSRIRTAREKTGMYQNKLAEKLGLTSGRIISNWENNIARPDADNIVKLCRELDVSAAYLIGYYGSAGESEDITTSEYELVKRYRALDGHGREMTDVVMAKERERMLSVTPEKRSFRQIPFFDYAASAGTGLYLSDVEAEIIRTPVNKVTAEADYIIPVSGDSMEPEYYDGDCVCIKVQPVIERGEIGVFLINGDAFIKKYEGDRLVSLNKKYADIPLRGNDSVFCKGLVLGKL